MQTRFFQQGQAPFFRGLRGRVARPPGPGVTGLAGISAREPGSGMIPRVPLASLAGLFGATFTGFSGRTDGDAEAFFSRFRVSCAPRDCDGRIPRAEVEPASDRSLSGHGSPAQGKGSGAQRVLFRRSRLARLRRRNRPPWLCDAHAQAGRWIGRTGNRSLQADPLL